MQNSNHGKCMSHKNIYKCSDHWFLLNSVDTKTLSAWNLKPLPPMHGIKCTLHKHVFFIDGMLTIWKEEIVIQANELKHKLRKWTLAPT